jgi:hypothetical protein
MPEPVFRMLEVALKGAIAATGTKIVEQTQAALRASMNALLHEAQESYPHPAGAYWVPSRLGGAAPTPEEAKALDEADLIQRANQRADHPKTARKLVELSPRRWRVVKTARLPGIGESRRHIGRTATSEQPKQIA